MIECPHTHNNPEDFYPLFDKLKSHGIEQGRIVDGLAKFEDKQLLGFVEELRSLFPIWQYDLNTSRSPYAFLANSGLSGLRGDPYPAVRLAPVDSLARFAVLYADTVFIREPLSTERFSESGFPIMRDYVTVELAILLALKPLLEAGIVKIARNNFPIGGANPEELTRQNQ